MKEAVRNGRNIQVAGIEYRQSAHSVGIYLHLLLRYLCVRVRAGSILLTSRLQYTPAQSDWRADFGTEPLPQVKEHDWSMICLPIAIEGFLLKELIMQDLHYSILLLALLP